MRQLFGRLAIELARVASSRTRRHSARPISGPPPWSTRIIAATVRSHVFWLAANRRRPAAVSV